MTAYTTTIDAESYGQQIIDVLVDGYRELFVVVNHDAKSITGHTASRKRIELDVPYATPIDAIAPLFAAHAGIA